MKSMVSVLLLTAVWGPQPSCADAPAPVGTAEAAIQAQQKVREQWVREACPPLEQMGTEGGSAALAEFRRRIDAAQAELAPGRGRLFEWQYLNRLRVADPGAVMAHLRTVVAGSDAGVAKWAQGEINVEKLRSEPIDLAFLAVDGRQVDLAAMRGKVVLLDFWATWCGPCKAELPNVVAVYEKYRERGFEVVAVSLDKPQERQKLLDYVAEHKLPWPQHFDGVNPRNEIAERYGVLAIPSMFLFDTSGRLVTTHARGEKLEQQVTRLLGPQGAVPL